IHSHTDTNELRRSRLTFTRLLGNLLSSCRSYLDHAPHYLGQLDGEQAEVFLARTREAYDAELGYRFMEALRNHAQHRGSPLHGTSFNSRWVERDSEDTFLQYSVGASVNVDDLRADRKFKRSILKDFAEDERIDVLAMARIYIEKLGQLHSQCRDDTSSLMERNKRLLRSALDRYQRETGESRIGVAIARSNNDRTVQSFDHLPEDVIDWYESLVKRNRNVVNLRKRFVSNELLPERKGSPRGI
ncbi:MAG: hypothetical protein LH610_00305, partial [Sphingomonas bacterium]|nr:hypothetical protein [Sphingomonas bacterium]